MLLKNKNNESIFLCIISSSNRLNIQSTTCYKSKRTSNVWTLQQRYVPVACLMLHSINNLDNNIVLIKQKSGYAFTTKLVLYKLYNCKDKFSVNIV